MSHDASQDRAVFDAHLGLTKSGVDRAMVAFLEAEVSRASALRPDLGFVAELVRDLSLRGGKRFRAALLSASFIGFGGSDFDTCTRAQVALELLQVYLLIHDDWMDGDETRRGRRSVPAALRDRYGASSYADAAAILAGDYVSAIGQSALAGAQSPHVARACARFADMQRDVVFGQLLDVAPAELASMNAMSPAARMTATERTYALKTGSYTVRGPLELGAVLAGADAGALERLARFAEPLGVAFQLRDDLLSTFGAEHATGKPAYGDLRTGKLTWLIEAARAHAGARDAMTGVFGNPDAPQEARARLARAIEASGAKAALEARLAELAEKARAALPEIGLTPSMQRVVSGAISALTERES